MGSTSFLNAVSLLTLLFTILRISTSSNVCNDELRDSLEHKCESAYDTIEEVAQDIEDDKKREETFCCALEVLEDCTMQAYDIAHCKSDKPKLKENLKAARLFLSVVSNVTCNEFKKLCSSSNSVFLHPWCLILLGLTLIAGRV